MQAMIDLSGQSKAPTMDWDGEVLADFGVPVLEQPIPINQIGGYQALVKQAALPILLKKMPDVLAITGASAALMISEAPWAGPVAGVRVARVQGKFIAFPSWEQMKVADILLVVAVSRDAIIMVEGGAEQALEADMIDALMFAKQMSLPLVEAQKRLVARAGKPKLPWRPWSRT